MTEIIIPALGESVTSAQIGRWHKKQGDLVRKDEVLVTLETDKVAQDLTATDNGTLNVLVQEGTEVTIGTIIGRITIETSVSTSTTSTPIIPSEPSEKFTQPSKSSPTLNTQASPTLPAPTESPKIELPPIPTSEINGESRFTRKKMSPLRKKIAAQLVAAQRHAAMLTTFNECDMSAVIAMRKEMQEAFTAKHGVKLGFMSFFIKAVVDALEQIPQINTRIDGDDIITNHYIDIGMAVGTDKGLIVPVIRECKQKSFAQLESELAALAARAREGKIQIQELQGGVFTITNGGIYGSLMSTPILNPPQSAILGLHTIKERPIVINGQIVARPMMYLALSYDHRVIDGKEAVQFLIRIKDCIENPARLFLGI